MASTPVIPPDESRGPTINIVGWVGAGIATLFVALRVYSRLYIIRSADWDDVIIVIAAILNIVTIALCSASVAHGAGRHIYYLSEDDITNSLYFIAIQRPPGILSYCLPKLSVAIFLVKLMGTARRGVWFLYSVIAVLFITSILAFVLYLVQCNPTDHLWHPSSPAECIPDYVLDTVTYVAGSWSAFTDIVLASFPIYLLWQLQMKRSRKISIMMVMAFGFFASITAIAKTTQLPKNHAADASWDSFGLSIATYLETDLVIIAACAPALPKLIKRMLGREPKKPASSRYPSNHPVARGYRAFGSSHNLADITHTQGNRA